MTPYLAIKFVMVRKYKGPQQQEALNTSVYGVYGGMRYQLTWGESLCDMDNDG